MSEVKNVSVRFGVPFLPLLTLLFIGLKLGEIGVVAGWSWWLVWAPLWVPVALVLGIWGLIIGLGATVVVGSYLYRKAKGKK
ncbi:transmembrane protein [Xanthomonas phage X1]|nr:transmembrane protein [Xanthomonas phage X1]